jgi:hypothetical protein
MAWKITVQITSLACIGLGGWFTGILTERRKLQQRTCDCSCDNLNNLLHNLKAMPGLPIYGTVSAASPANVLGSDLVPVESSPASSKPSRVSQVKYILRTGFFCNCNFIVIYITSQIFMTGNKTFGYRTSHNTL